MDASPILEKTTCIDDAFAWPENDVKRHSSDTDLLESLDIAGGSTDYQPEVDACTSTVCTRAPPTWPTGHMYRGTEAPAVSPTHTRASTLQIP